MRSWVTNPWSGLCEPHWELSVITNDTIQEIAVGTHIHAQHGTKNCHSIFSCWWKNILITTAKISLFTIRQHSATRKTHEARLILLNTSPVFQCHSVIFGKLNTPTTEVLSTWTSGLGGWTPSLLRGSLVFPDLL